MSNSKHNDGQQDRSAGKSYDKPHGVVKDLTTWSSNGMKELAKD